jgi:nucleotide-binding universal stress UspA family protein
MKTTSSGHPSDQAASLHLETTRLRFANILVPIDFSRSAEHALEVAGNFAKRFDSRLILIYALPPVMPSAEVPLDPAFIHVSIEDAKQQMDELVKKLNPSVHHQEIVYLNSAVGAIKAAAIEHNIDLIIMGSHGASGLEKLVMGSVAEAVLRSSHTPVMVVGPNCKPSNCKTDEKGMQLRSIVLATDLVIGSLRPAQYAAALAEESNSSLTLVNVGSESQGASELARKQVAERLKNLIPDDASLWCDPHTRAVVGDASEQILKVALAEKADLIVAGSSGSGPLLDHVPWSTLSKVIRGAACPVLAVQPHF